MLRSSTGAARARWRRHVWRNAKKARQLAEELSPRTEMLERWVDALQSRAAEMNELELQIGLRACSAAARALKAKNVKQLRDLILQYRTTPEELNRLLEVLKVRRSAYQKVRRELAEANLRLVVSIAKRYRNRGLAFGLSADRTIGLVNGQSGGVDLLSRIRIVERTGSTNADLLKDDSAVEGDWLIARRISLVAVCCSSRSCSSENSRAFSIAIAAWSAKVSTS